MAAPLMETLTECDLVKKNPKKRRPRTSAKQLAVLQEAYTLESMPCAHYRELLAKQVDLSARSIQIWFQNKRQKLKMNENKAQKAKLESKREFSIKVLNSFFLENQLPNDAELQKISEQIGITKESVSIWFKSKEMRQKIEQQMSSQFQHKNSPIVDDFIQRNAKRVNEIMYSKNRSALQAIAMATESSHNMTSDDGWHIMTGTPSSLVSASKQASSSASVTCSPPYTTTVKIDQLKFQEVNSFVQNHQGSCSINSNPLHFNAEINLFNSNYDKYFINFDATNPSTDQVAKPFDNFNSLFNNIGFHSFKDNSFKSPDELLEEFGF
jgi:uncharacterized protein YajQ (UPF0234 family)